MHHKGKLWVVDQDGMGGGEEEKGRGGEESTGGEERKEDNCVMARARLGWARTE